MHRLLPMFLLLLSTATVHAGETSCTVESDFDLTINERSVILTRDSGVPKWIVIRGEQLFVDDQWVQLTAGDRKRIAAFDRGSREIMPLAREIGRDAADIAFTALGEVAAGFSNNPASTRGKLDQARKQIDARLARSISANRFDGGDLGDGIGQAVGEVMPTLIGDIVGGAVSAAFSGDTARLGRMENLDKQIEARVKPRAEALEKRAEALCERMIELDRVDNSLAYRRPDGTALNLLQASRDLPSAPAK